MIVGLSVAYYYAWMEVLPRLGGYSIARETLHLEGGAITNRFVKAKRRETPDGNSGGSSAPLLGTATYER